MKVMKNINIIYPAVIPHPSSNQQHQSGMKIPSFDFIPFQLRIEHKIAVRRRIIGLYTRMPELTT